MNPNPMQLPPPVIDSRASFIAALHWGFGHATEGGARRIVCCDTDFAAWPLGDAAVLTALTAWLRLPLRRLVLLASDVDTLPRLQPRFCDWRRDWVHAVDAWQPPPDLRHDLPTLLCSDGNTSIELLDGQLWRGRAAVDARRAHRQLASLDALLQHCSAALASRRLGL